MGLVIHIYRNDLLLAGFHLLMLAALIYALVRIGRHPGPSICVILAIVLDYAAFLLGPVSVIGGYDVEWSFAHSVPGKMRMVSVLLLCVGVFAWRSRRPQTTAHPYGVAPIGPEAAPLPMTTGAVRIPVGWTVTVTIVIVLTALHALALLLAMAGDADRDIREALAMTFLAGAPLTSILNTVFIMMILHRAWKAIQDEHVPTTPGKAVGYLFIPLFNFYWVFVAIGGYAAAFNAYAARHRIPARQLSPALFYAHCVLALVGIPINFVPGIGLIYAVVVSIMPLLVLWGITGAVNDAHTYLTHAQTAPADSGQEPIGPQR